ncbi:MAG TPA: acyltransferase [Pseudomonas sp.]|jgi:peptidoglycan/LPS O-acetylase OafA/YrhL
MNQVHRFDVLDSFRGLCAVCVVFFHIQLVSGFTESVFIRNADLLVNFFFVLSGFVLAYAYGSRKSLDFKTFLIARTFRLVPLHWAMLVCFVVLEVFKLVASQRGIALNYAPFTGAFAPSEFLPNLLLVQAWTPFTEIMSFNYPSWSISVEFYLYLIFAAFTLLRSRARYLAWGVVSLMAFSLLYLHIPLLTERALIGLACFFAGAVTFRLFAVARPVWRPSQALMTTLELLALIGIAIMNSLRFANQSLFASLMFCVVVWIFAFEGGYVSGVLKARPFALLGKLSYSLYMTHVAVLFCLMSVFIILEQRSGRHLTTIFETRRYLDTGSAVGNSLLAVGFLAVVVMVSMLTYRYIEQKGQAMGRRLIARHAARIEPANLTAT